MTVPQPPLTKIVRIVISVLLIAHLLAVVLPPLAFQTNGPIGQSPSIAAVFATPLEAYGQAVYIDRGYAFFAPDPGPSHLVQVAVTGPDGIQTESMIPDREVHWPRLLYHRHFMLTEFLDEIHQPPGPPPELIESAPQEAEFWTRTRARYEHVRQSVVEHLKHVNPGREVAIRRIEHLIPDVIEAQRNPVSLIDPDSYRVLLDEPIEQQSVALDLMPPSAADAGSPLAPLAPPATGDIRPTYEPNLFLPPKTPNPPAPDRAAEQPSQDRVDDTATDGEDSA